MQRVAVAGKTIATFVVALVNSAAQLDTLRDETWIYRGVHLIEFVDFSDAGNLYQKTRVIVVDGVPYPRHSVISDNWAINAGSRVDVMDGDASLRQREERFLAYLSETGLSKRSNVFSAIHERIGLDIFGIDFAMVDDEIIVFEANACMHFLAQRREHNDYRYLDGYVRELRRAVKRMLMQG